MYALQTELNYDTNTRNKICIYVCYFPILTNLICGFGMMLFISCHHPKNNKEMVLMRWHKECFFLWSFKSYNLKSEIFGILLPAPLWLS